MYSKICRNFADNVFTNSLYCVILRQIKLNIWGTFFISVSPGLNKGE
ncbi:MAG: hypothetical protein HPY66_2894 [Firmicutes bacterium]|nr:hypothetical protein [Bacillota bacterium]